MTLTHDLRESLGDFGILCGERLISFRGNRNYACYCQLPFDAVLKLVDGKRHENRKFHWVVWDSHAGKLRDPNPVPYSIPPAKIKSYLAVKYG